MIYKQRPEATACAEYDLWNDRMNRYVKRGSKGIALLDMRGEQPKLRYVFDVADTGERKNSRPVQLWNIKRCIQCPNNRLLMLCVHFPELYRVSGKSHYGSGGTPCKGLLGGKAQADQRHRCGFLSGRV